MGSEKESEATNRLRLALQVLSKFVPGFFILVILIFLPRRRPRLAQRLALARHAFGPDGRHPRLDVPAKPGPSRAASTDERK